MAVSSNKIKKIFIYVIIMTTSAEAVERKKKSDSNI